MLCVSHPNHSNLRSLEEPSQRELASALLKAWGILETFQSLSETEQRGLLPSLVELYALPTDVVLESDLQSRKLDVHALARQGYIEVHGRHKAALIEPDEEGPEEVMIDLPADPEQVAFQGADGRTATMPRGLVQQYMIRRSWVEETIADNLRPCFACWSFARLEDHLAHLGELALSRVHVPCYLAGWLEHRAVFERVDIRLRGENNGRRGIVSTPATAACRS